MHKPCVDILLAAYNGQKYLAAQIDSIVAQSYQDWRLLIRDDGSVDKTIKIIEDYTGRLPDKIRLVKDSENHLGASLNFGKLMEYADSEYIMFCDQDDVWLPNKIESTLNAMKAAERTYPDKPVLVHTDLKVMDYQMNTIADSMWRYQKISPEIGDDLNKIMAQNVVTGCTVMINKSAKVVSMPIPKEAMLYDWWIALNVCKHGKIVYLSTPSVLYRQHADNQVGAQKVNVLHFLKKLCSVRELMSARYRMIQKFDPTVSLWRLVWNKTRVKAPQLFR